MSLLLTLVDGNHVNSEVIWRFKPFNKYEQWKKRFTFWVTLYTKFFIKNDFEFECRSHSRSKARMHPLAPFMFISNADEFRWVQTKKWLNFLSYLRSKIFGLIFGLRLSQNLGLSNSLSERLIQHCTSCVLSTWH